MSEVRARFFREAETAGRLNHPNIVTVYDVGEEGSLAYIAMEYLKGRHLSDFTTPAALLPEVKVLDLVARAAQALGFAHRQNVIHRDVKPANLMYDPAGDTLKITDFGIARLTDTASTRTGIVLGTPSFMSPEQLEGRIVNGRSDLFSLGVTLFQLLTGQLPFRADSMTALMEQIAERPHPPLRSIRPDLPACVGSIIDRALAKDPDTRFENGAQMAAALDACRTSSFSVPA
jgi:eukaryotic-like serine/threonine-protein kinase